MKPSIITLVFALTTVFANAQQDYKALLNTFYQHSENGFKNIIGQQTDTESLFYPSKLTADVGEVKIYKTSFAVTLNWIIPLEQSKAVQQAVQDFMKAAYADTKLYKMATVGPDEDDPTTIAAAYMLKPDGGKPVKVFQAMTDKKQFAITMYGKN